MYKTIYNRISSVKYACQVIYVKPMENVNKYPYPQIWITRGVEMQSMKINMITMETTLLKTNCLQYMYAMILAQIVLLNVYCVYNCNFLESKHRYHIS